MPFVLGLPREVHCRHAAAAKLPLEHVSCARQRGRKGRESPGRRGMGHTVNLDVGDTFRIVPMTPPTPSDVAQAYDRWAASYDADKNVTRDLDAVVVRRVSLPLENRDVLELGCGTGKNTTFLAEHARRVVAMDFSEGMIARAHERIATNNVEFVRHDVREVWPVPSASVDLVIGNLILEHVHDLAVVFFETARVLRPAGQVFYCELHPYRQMLGSQAQFTDQTTGERVCVSAHAHTVSEYVNGAIEAGLQLRALGEWTEDGAAASTPPRLISLLFERS
jgi:ubiquinone/menaquinone biosynthesis C-methylase UbiE